jgi:diadenosine tetraphosphate (Ap4A) HIT family hydrolase
VEWLGLGDKIMNEKNKGTECTFCELGPKKLMTTIPLYMKENINKSNVAENGLDEKLIVRTEKIVELDRWIDYEKNNGDFVWYAILSPEQYSKGHTLVILKKHRSDITDNELNLKEIEQLNE